MWPHAPRGVTPHMLVVTNDAAPFRTTGLPVIPDRIKGVGAFDGLTICEVGPDELTPDDGARARGSAGGAAAADR